jgi:hypothetical protein
VCDFLPVYRRLEGFFELIVANAQHIKAVAGRKTDVQDADWIAERYAAWFTDRQFCSEKGDSKTCET